MMVPGEYEFAVPVCSQGWTWQFRVSGRMLYVPKKGIVIHNLGGLGVLVDSERRLSLGTSFDLKNAFSLEYYPALILNPVGRKLIVSCHDFATTILIPDESGDQLRRFADELSVHERIAGCGDDNYLAFLNKSIGRLRKMVEYVLDGEHELQD